jgi:hypothetical protein
MLENDEENEKQKMKGTEGQRKARGAEENRDVRPFILCSFVLLLRSSVPLRSLPLGRL